MRSGKPSIRLLLLERNLKKMGIPLASDGNPPFTRLLSQFHPTPRLIIGLSQFVSLRMDRNNQQQAALVSQKINELTREVKEIEVLCQTLAEVSPDRRCHKLVGGTLMAYSAKDLLPIVRDSKPRIEEVIKNLNHQLTKLQETA